MRDINSYLGGTRGCVRMFRYRGEISEELWQLFGDFSSDCSGSVLKLGGRHPTGNNIMGIHLEERTNGRREAEMSLKMDENKAKLGINITWRLQQQIPLTCIRGTSAESCFLMSSRFCSGSRRGEKSVTTAPSLWSATKPERTCPAEPISRWNWMFRVLHCCLEMGSSAVSCCS